MIEQLAEAVKAEQPDACIIAGDIGPAEHAGKWLTLLTGAIRVPIIICLGNQDYWLKRDLWTVYPNLAAIQRKLWLPAAHAAGVTCLDEENITIGDITITGGYGHFDLAMRDEALSANGQSAAYDDYLKGEFCGLICQDMRFLPYAADQVLAEATAQAEGMAKRLASAVNQGNRVLVVTHTAPFADLIGPKPHLGSLSRFWRAYAGNLQVGECLTRHASKIDLAVCGHTQSLVAPKEISGVLCTNLGSRPDAPRYLIFEPSSSTPLRSLTSESIHPAI
jgi:Icc-related predicted phosphoesterase